MPIMTVSYDRIISSNDLEETGSGNEKILTAKPYVRPFIVKILDELSRTQ